MKKFFIIISCLALVLFFPKESSAQGGIEVRLLEPETLEKGKEVEYILDVKFNEPNSNFDNLFITMRISEGLSYTGSEILGANSVQGKFEAAPVKNKEKDPNYFNVKVTDTNALNGADGFRVSIKAVVNDRSKIGEYIENSLTSAYQYKDKSRKTETIQLTQKSNFPVSEYKIAENPIEKPSQNPLPDNPGKNNGNLNPNQNQNPNQNSNPQNSITDNQPQPNPNIPNPQPDSSIGFLTGNSFSDFFERVVVISRPNTDFEVEYLGENPLKFRKTSDMNGRFSITIPKGFKSDISISVYGNSKASFARVSYVDERNISMENITNLVQSYKNNGDMSIINSILQEAGSNLGYSELVFGANTVPNQEIFSLYQKLHKEIMKRETGNHKAFMNGYPDNSFMPARQLTRAEMAAIISRIIYDGEVEKRAAKFPDVEESMWYSKYIAHVSEIGIMKGYEDGKFMPKRIMTRAELATIIARINNLTERGNISFSDLDSNFWGTENILKVANAGIMKGYPNGTFDAKRELTRAEAATTINRALKRIPDEQTIDNSMMNKFKDIKNHWSFYQVIEATSNHDYIFDFEREYYR